MRRVRIALALVAVVLLAQASAAAPPPLLIAQGTVHKVERTGLTIQPRTPDGKFGKPILLTLTGTSKVSSVSAHERAGKLVIRQRDIQPRDLQPNQTIAVVYTSGKEGLVLLTAVVQIMAK